MIEKYLEYVKYTRWLSICTVILYRNSLKRFEIFLNSIWKELEAPEKITIQDIFSFTTWMSKKWLSEKTIRSNLLALRVFFHYLEEIMNMNVLEWKKIKWVKVHEKNIWFYNEEEKSQILKTVDQWIGKKDITKLRNKVLTYMLMYTWLRCHEVAKIKVGEIWESLQVVGKWWKRRTVYLRPELLDMIWDYLSKREKESDYLFPSHNIDGGHIREWSIRNIYNKLTKKLWFRIFPHKFRNTFCTDLLHIPWSSIYDVAKLMGHSSIKTTEIYLWTNSDILKKLQFWLQF
jgi:site-specific recombinase XerD